MGQKPPSRAWFWLLEFVLFWGLYLLFAGSLQRAELLVGVAVAALGATATEVVHGQGFAHFRPRISWLLYALALPWYVLSGTGEIFLALAKYALQIEDPRSLHRAVRFDSGGTDPRSQARRALATVYCTVPPNFLILGILHDAGLMLFHQISPSGVPRIVEKLGARP